MNVRAKPVGGRPHASDGLILTAERLFATHGLDGVSLRQIAVEAGHRNPGAVQYHFGSKEGLVQAIVEYRLPWINQRRAELLDQLDSQQRSLDLRGLVEVMARPYLEMDPESYYVQFLQRLSLAGAFSLLTPVYQEADDLSSERPRLVDRMEIALRFLPPGIRANRQRMARDLMYSTVADRQARRASGRRVKLDDELFATELHNAMVGLLTAPHSLPWPE